MSRYDHPGPGDFASPTECEPMDDDEPYVCPGCYAVGGEPCALDCIDAEIRRDREDAYDRSYSGIGDGSEEGDDEENEEDAP
jgi:hypothetical protein